MTVRTLAEAAAEIMNGNNKKLAPNAGVTEPMKKVDAEVVDLGGATHDTPEGNAVGKKAADAASGPAGLSAKGKPTDAKTPHNEEVASDEEVIEESEELTEEEFEALLASLSEEELAALEEELAASDEEVVEEDAAAEEVVEEEAELTEEEIAEAKAAKKAMVKAKMKNGKWCEGVEAIFNGESLSEEFMQKASTIFEAAVIERAAAIVEEIEQDILAVAEESVAAVKAELEEQVDSYLSYVVENWVKDNEVAIETGLRAEIVEDFVSDLRNLFVEHYIDVPEAKVDVVEEMFEEVEELKSKLNEALNANIELNSFINEAKKKEVLLSICEGLTATQVEKMKSLAESVEFTTEGEYSGKLGVLKENYFTAKVKAPVSSIEKSDETTTVNIMETSGVMSHYVNAISRTKAQ